MKNVENRTWSTNPGWLAIHAGKAYDEGAHRDVVAAAAFVDDDRVRRLRRADLPTGAIIAVAEVVDVHFDGTSSCRPPEGGRCSLWAQPGVYHWRLDNVIELAEPIPALGMLGIRRLPPDLQFRIAEQTSKGHR